MIDPEAIRRAVRAALDEDIGPGDLTSRLTIDESARAKGDIFAREDLVVAGLSLAREVFRQVDGTLEFSARCEDGERRTAGDVCATIEGPARSILAGERTALNFMQRLCGIATATRRAVDSLGGARVQIAATRKTAPGLRALDKHAVEIGGGVAHRQGLFDAVLIKDNHWRLCGGIENAIATARARMAREGRVLPIEIEAGTLDEVGEALRARRLHPPRQHAAPSPGGGRGRGARAGVPRDLGGRARGGRPSARAPGGGSHLARLSDPLGAGR